MLGTPAYTRAETVRTLRHLERDRDADRKLDFEEFVSM